MHVIEINTLIITSMDRLNTRVVLSIFNNLKKLLENLVAYQVITPYTRLVEANKVVRIV